VCCRVCVRGGKRSCLNDIARTHPTRKFNVFVRVCVCVCVCVCVLTGMCASERKVDEVCV